MELVVSKKRSVTENLYGKSLQGKNNINEEMKQSQVKNSFHKSPTFKYKLTIKTAYSLSMIAINGQFYTKLFGKASGG